MALRYMLLVLATALAGFEYCSARSTAGHLWARLASLRDTEADQKAQLNSKVYKPKNPIALRQATQILVRQRLNIIFDLDSELLDELTTFVRKRLQRYWEKYLKDDDDDDNDDDDDDSDHDNDHDDDEEEEEYYHALKEEDQSTSNSESDKQSPTESLADIDVLPESDWKDELQLLLSTEIQSNSDNLTGLKNFRTVHNLDDDENAQEDAQHLSEW